MKYVITGGAGSIGSEVARRLAKEGRPVRVFDISEEGLWSIKAELPQVETVLGDVQSLDDVSNAVQGASVVIHCAALKHVDQCERSPAIAHRVNVGGTLNVIRACESGCARLVVVSTDKAIDAVSVMGRTKAEAEQYAIIAGANVVRFGNVIGTRGSLVPMVLRCINKGLPVPLTDSRMTRFFMTADDAVDLIMEAAESEKRCTIFAPMRPRACNVHRFINACYASREADCKHIGLRPGERLHEPMQLRSGAVVWSNDLGAQMTEIELQAIVHSAIAKLRREAA